MDKESFTEQNKSFVVTLQSMIDSGTLMLDQMEAALRVKRILQKMGNAHSEQRLKNLTAALTAALAQLLLKEKSRNELWSEV